MREICPLMSRIGHDNAKLRADWFLERVEIDIPKFGQAWKFPCGKWLSKSKGDRQLEVELYAKSRPTETYAPSTILKISFSFHQAFLIFFQRFHTKSKFILQINPMPAQMPMYILKSMAWNSQLAK